jgi:hypothetical protein
VLLKVHSCRVGNWDDIARTGGWDLGRHPPMALGVDRVTYLRLEIVGPRMVSVVGDVDLTGDDTESHLAVRLRALEAKISASPAVAGTVLSLSAPDEPSLVI